MNDDYRVYPYRWIVLISFMFVAAMTQLLWITFAPITSQSAEFFHTTDMSIGLLSMSFMIVYIIVVIPAAWLIDTYGFRAAVGLGAILTAVFALTRGLFAANYKLVFASQVGIAIGQPLIAGAVTSLAARWFPAKERATAAGLGTLALYIGILVAMIITPAIAQKHGIPTLLIAYGIAAAAAALIFLVFGRSRPPTPACPPDQEARALMFDGLKQMIRQKNFILLLLVFFVGLGLFNGVSTWIEDIIRPRGFNSSQAGMLGGLMIIGGVVGAVVMPMLSDSARRRKPYILLSLAGMVPSLLGIVFATSYWLLLVSGAVFGFFLLSSGPIGFQFGAELTYPAPEGTSNSLLMAMGQISGIIFIFAMDALRAKPSGSMTTSLLGLVGLTAISIILAALIREKPLKG